MRFGIAASTILGLLTKFTGEEVVCAVGIYVYDMRDVGYVQDVETRCRLCIAMALIYHIELNLNLCSWYVSLTPTSLLQL